MITKQEILEDFWEQFPQYKEITPTYDDIRFEEEELIDWNNDWIFGVFNNIEYYTQNKIKTIKDLEKIIKLE